MVKSATVARIMVLFRVMRLLLALSVSSLLLTLSSMQLGDRTERVRAFTRDIEFDYAGWTLNALQVKLFETSLSTASYLSPDVRGRYVREYLSLAAQIRQIDWAINTVFANPEVTDPHSASEELLQQLAELNARRDLVAPLAESVLQNQISAVVDLLGLAPGGQPLPPVLYHSTPLPLALIVSPRVVIRQEEDISLLPTLNIDQRTQLEARVDQALDMSSLVVEIGGVGTYPTMVQQTSDMVWLSEVVAHEWVHNFLTTRPLGVNYLTSIELRIMNETTASIAGKEIGRLVLETYYPELVPPPETQPTEAPPESAETEPPAFDYRAEMHITRLEADRLLADGLIKDAEEYMEMRRRVFWENGYRHLRKINQAYFAFYGAYADQPGGAVGGAEEPVGAAVRKLRLLSPNLAAFLNRISWITSFEDLLQAIQEGS